MAQDNQLRNIPLEEVIQALIAVLKRPALTDFSTEVKCKCALTVSPRGAIICEPDGHLPEYRWHSGEPRWRAMLV